ncbi:serine carboxypeptidase-like 50 [Corylus avellana]|uniref:serine carboxypeptidase-like 50 n=1 Tax=Corylus avellana TaxID=13451 RepID=UPI00286C15F1|nr:serine carboxypeptidase-like 50 [Corylus avellana]
MPMPNIMPAADPSYLNGFGLWTPYYSKGIKGTADDEPVTTTPIYGIRQWHKSLSHMPRVPPAPAAGAEESEAEPMAEDEPVVGLKASEEEAPTIFRGPQNRSLTEEIASLQRELVGQRKEARENEELMDKRLGALEELMRPRDQFSVASHLFAAITSFIELDPLFKSRLLYFVGECYAGKLVPAIGYHILKANAYLPVSKWVNLAGVAIANGLTDPVNQVSTHATNAYYSGLINERQRDELEKLQRVAINLTKMGKWREATNARSHVLSMLKRMIGLATLHDFSKKDHPYETEMVFDFLRKGDVKKALGVKETLVQDVCSDDVATALHDDFMKSVKFMVEFLVKRSKVLLYEGHLDMRDSVVSTEAWVKKFIKNGKLVRFIGEQRSQQNDNRRGKPQEYKPREYP